MADAYLLENGTDRYLVEDGTGVLVLEGDAEVSVYVTMYLGVGIG